ncbi:MAG: hypothetical protein ABSB32_13645 [Thermodesulfobacteriota bacterium]|jgi:hypothetical protein
MIKYLILIAIFILLIPSMALSQKAGPTIADFKVQAEFRAAKLTWQANGELKNEMAVQVLRATSSEEGPYTEVAVVEITPGKQAYQYVDKSMRTEAQYYYKLIVKETNESFGPLPSRPFFSPPAT